MNAPRDKLDVSRFGSGKTVRRIEDPTLVAGKGQFTDDLTRPGQTHLIFLRSPHAHARIVSVDLSGALALPGVLAVYSGATLVAAGVKPIAAGIPFPRPDGSPAASAPRHPLALDRARYVGEAVAAVVAQSRDAALAGIDALRVEYEELPAVVDAVSAMAPGAPVLCDAAPDNIASEMRHGDAAATAAAFARAAHTVQLDIVNQRIAPSAIEPRVVLAEIDAASGRLHTPVSGNTSSTRSAAALSPAMSATIERTCS